MTACPKCGSEDVIVLFTSVQCNKCGKGDPWSDQEITEKILKPKRRLRIGKTRRIGLP